MPNVISLISGNDDNEFETNDINFKVLGVKKCLYDLWLIKN
jgi:hypothetical protein